MSAVLLAALLFCASCSSESLFGSAAINGGDSQPTTGAVTGFSSALTESENTGTHGESGIGETEDHSGSANKTLTGNLPGSIYDENTAVVVNTAVDVYYYQDKTSTRITQLLFNQPVEVLEEDDQWVRLRLEDGTVGWSRIRNIDWDWTCLEQTRYLGKIVVTGKEKQIYSHPRNGIVVRDVGMGTELFVHSKSDNVYEVALPGNLIGWISENGTFQLNTDEAIKKTDAKIFAQSCEKFRGTSYLQGGVSFQGIDGAGILYVAMKVNGVELPHDLRGQFALGEEVNPADIEIGDVLFFSSTGEGNDLANAGVYTGDGMFIQASQHAGKVQYTEMSDPYYQQRLKGIKRYF